MPSDFFDFSNVTDWLHDTQTNAIQHDAGNDRLENFTGGSTSDVMYYGLGSPYQIFGNVFNIDAVFYLNESSNQVGALGCKITLGWFTVAISTSGTDRIYLYEKTDQRWFLTGSNINLFQTDVSITAARWHWIRMRGLPNGDIEIYSMLNQTDDSKSGVWTRHTDLDHNYRNQVSADEAFVTEYNLSMNNGGTSIIYADTLTFNTTGIEGLDESIKFGDRYFRTALNGGGNALFSAPAPFYSAVSATTFKAQEKKQVTYTNAFGIIQFKGEVGSIRLSTHGAAFTAEEMIRKTMFTEVGGSPVIFSTVLRQWNSLVITDKDGDFVNRGITTSHIAAFAKADTKTYEGRATRDAFTITEVDLSTPLVPNQISNDKDEEMYYFDKWTVDDTDKAHIVLNIPVDLLPFVVKYPVDLYEKFNNLTKLNKLEIKTVISAVRTTNKSWTSIGGDSGKYFWYLYNYQLVAFEVIVKHGENALSGDSTASTVQAGSLFYDPQYITVDVLDELKSGVADWDVATTYSSGDRAINADTLYTYIDGTPSSGQEPPGNKWQRTVYDFINYESTAGSASIFSKLNCIIAIRTTVATDIDINGFWMWDFSVKITFDEDNEPEFSSASIQAVAATTVSINATSGINLPEKDGFGVGDALAFVKSTEDYLQDAWDPSELFTKLGALNLNITNGSTTGVIEDHTNKSFFILMQHISELTNSTFWADYDVVSTVEMVSADNHSSSGMTLTRDDIEGYNTEEWEITYDATKQRNQIRILGDNVNFLKIITPDADPFDLGDEIEIIEDSNIQTLLQASNLVDAMSPRLVSSEITASVTLNYSASNQDYTNVEVGKTIALKLPTASDTSIADFSTGNDGELLIIAIELNRNEETGDQDHVTLMLQRRYS